MSNYSLENVKALAMPVTSIFGQISPSDVSLSRVHFWTALDQVSNANEKFASLLNENPFWKSVMERHNCSMAGHPKIFFEIERQLIPSGVMTQTLESELRMFVLDNRYPVLQIVQDVKVPSHESSK